MGVDHARADSGGDGSGEGGNDSEGRELIENVLAGEELKNLDSNQPLSGVLQQVRLAPGWGLVKVACRR